MKRHIKLHVPSIPNSLVRYIPKRVRKQAFSTVTDRFHPPKTPSSQLSMYSNVQPTAKNKHSTSTMQQSHTVKTDHSRRAVQITSFVPSHKANLISLWEERENRVQEELVKSQLKDYNREINRSLRTQHLRNRISQAQQHKHQIQEKEMQAFKEKLLKDEARVIPKPRKKGSSCFCNSGRSPPEPLTDIGPGSYQHHQSLKRNVIVYPAPKKKPALSKKYLQEIIAEGQPEQSQEEEEVVPRRMADQWPQFKRSEKDRFGDSMYPVVQRTMVPGPGCYQTGETIWHRFDRVRKIEMQKDALRNWFNNHAMVKRG